MIPDGTYTAVVDEFEESTARLELQSVDDEGNLYELILEKSRLPAEGREIGSVLTVKIVDGEPAEMAFDPNETQRRREDVRTRFHRLSQRPSEDE
jgi:hypothetical protein